MSIPLVELLFDWRAQHGPRAQHMRDVENHYHIERVAENSAEIVEFQRVALQSHLVAARSNLMAIGQIDGTLRDGFGELGASIGSIAEALGDGFAEAIDVVNQQTEVIHRGLQGLAEQMLAQNLLLVQISSTLREPYATQVLELRRQADKWLVHGMRHTGRERDEDFKDAMTLLREVTKNPIGNQDYATWFEIGWLLWKHDGNIAGAEDAFRRAMRLSAHSGDAYHTLAARHLSHMQYLQSKFEEAYQTIIRHVNSMQTCGAFTVFDAARLAAKTKRKAEALKLLERCIDLDPIFGVRMFGEEDFQS